MTSRYASIPSGKQTESDILTKAYESDNYQEKVNLSMRTYFTESGKPMVVPVVRHVEALLAVEKSPYDSHVPIMGSPFFINLINKLILGPNSVAIRDQRCFSIQTSSLVGAMRIGAEFLKRICNYEFVYVSKPTIKIHKAPFIHAGFTIKCYRYYNHNTNGVNFDGMKEDIYKAPENSIILLQTSGHTPTGCDLTNDQWNELGDIILERNLFPFFVMCYQGLISGDLDVDAYAIRLFVEKGIEFFSAQTYEAKFGLYCERCGNMTVVVNNPNCVKPLQGQLSFIIRMLYSNPSYYAVKLITHILETPALFQDWKNTLKEVAFRLEHNRKTLREALERLNTPGNWEHLTEQRGIYSCIGLSRKQIIYLVKNKHVYMYRNGSINISGITKYNVEYVAKAIKETVTFLN